MSAHAPLLRRGLFGRLHGRLVWALLGTLVLAAGVGVVVDQVVIPRLTPSRQAAFQQVLHGLVSGLGGSRRV
jgi:hypothetical protein